MTNADSTQAPAAPAVNRHVARIGLVVVFGILISCFGLLIAASHASM